MQALGCEAETLPFAAQRYKVWRTPFGVDLEVPERFDVRDLPDGSSEARDAEGRVSARRAAGAYYFDPHGTPLAHLTEAREVERFAALFERWDYSSVYDEPLAASGYLPPMVGSLTQGGSSSIWTTGAAGLARSSPQPVRPTTPTKAAAASRLVEMRE